MAIEARLGLRRIFIAIAACSISLNSVAEARPSIFVPEQAGYSWWARELIIRPMAKTVRKVSIAAINAHLAAKSAVTPQKICFVEDVQRSDVLSVHRDTQKEIDETLAEFPQSFSGAYVAKSGKNFDVQVVTYQVCDAARGASALVITNADGSLHTFLTQEFDFTRIFKRADGKINVFGCFACGDVSELLYDSENDRFYQNWIGH